MQTLAHSLPEGSRLYNQLAPFYDMLFEDWVASTARQASILDELISNRWGRPTALLLDIAAGIGTQALGLANLGYPVVASDRARLAVARGQQAARASGLRLLTVAADFQDLPFRSGVAELVLAADNSLPHLLSDAAILKALRECHRCLRHGGGLVLTVRDYSPPPPPGTVEDHPYGWRRWGDKRLYVSQTWTWDGPCYDLRIVAAASVGGEPIHEFRSRYYAIPVIRLLDLCREAGFTDVRQAECAFYQPVILGTVSAVG